jgi:hypothetical protein
MQYLGSSWIEPNPYLKHTESLFIENIIHIELIVYLSWLLRPRANPGFSGLLVGTEMIYQWRMFRPNNNVIEMANIVQNHAPIA